MKSKYFQIIGIMIIVVTVFLLALFLIYGKYPIAQKMNSILIATPPGCFGLALFFMADELEKHLP